MSAFALVPFAVFVLCCVLQFWFMKRIRDRLIDRHPDVFLANERKALFPQNQIWGYLFSTSYHRLNDPELDRRIRQLRWLSIIAISSWLVLVMLMFARPRG